MRVVCPNCESMEAHSLSLLYREGVGGVRVHAGEPMSRTAAEAGAIRAVAVRRSGVGWSKDAAPPRRKHVYGWILISAIAGLLMVRSLSDFDRATLIFGAVAIVAAWLARSNHDFNTSQLPTLYSRWQQSFQCAACGLVFLVS